MNSRPALARRMMAQVDMPGGAVARRAASTTSDDAAACSRRAVREDVRAHARVAGVGEDVSVETAVQRPWPDGLAGQAGGVLQPPSDLVEAGCREGHCPWAAHDPRVVASLCLCP
jgi:hypothetical protein